MLEYYFEVMNNAIDNIIDPLYERGINIIEIKN